MTEKEINEISEKYQKLRTIEEFNKEKFKLSQKIDHLLESTLSQMDNHELLFKKLKKLEKSIDTNLLRLEQLKELKDRLFNNDMKKFMNS